MDSATPIRTLLKVAVVITGLIVLFFSGLFPVEDILTYIPQSGLTASVVPADVAALTNQERTKDGLPALTVSPLLTEAAQLKADDMARHSYYAHIGPDGKTPLDWLKAAGYNYLNAGENLVIDRDTSKEAVDAWMKSPDHRENILRPQFTEIGIGVAKGTFDGQDTIFVVQEFGTPYPTRAVVASAPKAAKAPAPVISTPKVAKPAVSIATTAPVLSLPQLTKPAIVSTAASYVKPVTQAKKPAVSIASTTNATSTEVFATSSAATSTVTYTLAPEFFTPIVIAASAEPSQQASPQALEYARPTLVQKITLYLSRISTTLRKAL